MWNHSGIWVSLQSVVEHTRTGVGLEGWCGGLWGTAFLVLSSVTGDCEIKISLVDAIVLVSNIKNLLVKWSVGFTIDWPEILFILPQLFGFSVFLATSLAVLCCFNGPSNNAIDVCFGWSSQLNPLLTRLQVGV